MQCRPFFFKFCIFKFCSTLLRCSYCTFPLATWNFIRSPKNHSDKFPLYFCFLWNKTAIVWPRFTTGTCSKNNFFSEGGGGRALIGPFWHQPHVLNDRALNDVYFFLNNTSRFLKKNHITCLICATASSKTLANARECSLITFLTRSKLEKVLFFKHTSRKLWCKSRMTYCTPV